MGFDTTSFNSAYAAGLGARLQRAKIQSLLDQQQRENKALDIAQSANALNNVLEVRRANDGQTTPGTQAAVEQAIRTLPPSMFGGRDGAPKGAGWSRFFNRRDDIGLDGNNITLNGEVVAPYGSREEMLQDLGLMLNNQAGIESGFPLSQIYMDMADGWGAANAADAGLGASVSQIQEDETHVRQTGEAPPKTSPVFNPTSPLVTEPSKQEQQAIDSSTAHEAARREENFNIPISSRLDMAIQDVRDIEGAINQHVDNAARIDIATDSAGHRRELKAVKQARERLAEAVKRRDTLVRIMDSQNNRLKKADEIKELIARREQIRSRDRMGVSLQVELDNIDAEIATRQDDIGRLGVEETSLNDQLYKSSLGNLSEHEAINGTEDNANPAPADTPEGSNINNEERLKHSPTPGQVTWEGAKSLPLADSLKTASVAPPDTKSRRKRVAYASSLLRTGFFGNHEDETGADKIRQLQAFVRTGDIPHGLKAQVAAVNAATAYMTAKVNQEKAARARNGTQTAKELLELQDLWTTVNTNTRDFAEHLAGQAVYSFDAKKYGDTDNEGNVVLNEDGVQLRARTMTNLKNHGGAVSTAAYLSGLSNDFFMLGPPSPTVVGEPNMKMLRYLGSANSDVVLSNITAFTADELANRDDWVFKPADDVSQFFNDKSIDSFLRSGFDNPAAKALERMNLTDEGRRAFLGGLLLHKTLVQRARAADPALKAQYTDLAKAITENLKGTIPDEYRLAAIVSKGMTLSTVQQ